MLNGKAIIIFLIAGFVKKTKYKWVNIFQNWNLTLDWSTYATKTDLKNATDFDISKFTKKVDLASLKSEVDKL